LAPHSLVVFHHLWRCWRFKTRVISTFQICRQS
jgi:hypothetical protein